MTDTRSDVRQEQGRRGRSMRLVGCLLLLVGIGTLGYVAWEYVGTTWLSHRTQAAIVDELEQSWTVEPAPDAIAPAELDTHGVKATAILRIPAFGDDFAVPVLEGTGDAELAAGVGHEPGTAEAGEVGNYALAGHRITHGEPFSDLPSLEAGDEVVVETATTVYTYELTSDGDALEITNTDTWVTDPLPTNPTPGGVEPAQKKGQRLLTLVTCADLFHSADRLAVFGKLVSEEPRTNAGAAAGQAR